MLPAAGTVIPSGGVAPPKAGEGRQTETIIVQPNLEAEREGYGNVEQDVVAVGKA